MKRIKLTESVIKTREQAVELAREIAILIVDKREMEAGLDRQIIRIRELFELGMSNTSKSIDEKVTTLQAWARMNPKEFSKSKSTDLTHAIVGWRTGQPALKTLKGWTWDKVLARLSTVEGYADFVRVKSEVDKSAIIAARERLLEGDLASMGVKIAQEESFFVEPKVTENGAAIVAEKEAA